MGQPSNGFRPGGSVFMAAGGEQSYDWCSRSARSATVPICRVMASSNSKVRSGTGAVRHSLGRAKHRRSVDAPVQLDSASPDESGSPRTNPAVEMSYCTLRGS